MTQLHLATDAVMSLDKDGALRYKGHEPIPADRQSSYRVHDGESWVDAQWALDIVRHQLRCHAAYDHGAMHLEYAIAALYCLDHEQRSELARISPAKSFEKVLDTLWGERKAMLAWSKRKRLAKWLV